MNTQCLRWLVIGSVTLTAPLMAEEVLSPVPDATVARAQFTTAIEEREPVDEVVVLYAPAAEVYFFTDLRRLEGRTVTHNWEHDGSIVSRLSFEVKGPRWRVFSKIELEPDQFGVWSVTVIDESGWPLHTSLFRYEPAQANPARE